MATFADGAHRCSGRTRDGMEWRWRDRPFSESRLFLYPDVGVPTPDDRMRFEQSLRVLGLFRYLQLPVDEVWVTPAVSRTQSEWTVDADFFPRWELRPGDRHSFLFGIVDRLWDGLEFQGQPPSPLEEEWVRNVAWEFVDDRSCRWPGGGWKGVLPLGLPGRVQKLLRKHPHRSGFVGLHPTPPKMDELL